MDKIRALLEQLGGSKELVDQILESLTAYKTKVEEDIKVKYSQRLDKAKEACLEEVQTFKKDLSHKTQIFFESRVGKIEQQIAKQVAIKDSAAETKLHAIAGLLEGVEANGESNNADIQAATKQIKELQEQVRKASGQNRVLAEKANRSCAIAEKTLERNKVLSKELASAEKPIAESKSKGKGKSKKVSKKAKSLTEGKKAKPVTTRRSNEGQLAKPRKKVNASAPASSVMGGFTPDGIAATMDTE